MNKNSILRSTVLALLFVECHPFMVSRRDPFNTRRPNPQIQRDIKTARFAMSSSWSVEASVTASSSKNAIRGCDVNDSLPSPREWMESIERTEGDNGGGIGAYTVVRCEITPSDEEGTGGFDWMDRAGNGMKENGVNEWTLPGNREPSDRWNIWGEGFHLDRLGSSYSELLVNLRGEQKEATLGQNLEMAVLDSKSVMRALLMKYEDDILRLKTTADVTNEANNSTDVLMLTLLWSPVLPTTPENEKDGTNDTANPLGICVRGHVTTLSMQRRLPSPVSANVALPFLEEKGPDSATQSELPNRYTSSPTAKVSSWCRSRRPLEIDYKSEGIGEVFMVRFDDASGEIKLLEGLTSNIFVVYGDGTLRTASSGVLMGYARERVLEVAEELGLNTVRTDDICLSDATKGLWKEVFVTSAVKIVTPVKEIWVPGGYAGVCDETEPLKTDLNGFQMIWSAPSASMPTSELIFSEIFKRELDVSR